MLPDRQTLVAKLRAELAFVESGGYRKLDRAQWRPQFIFEDSPTCLNSDSLHPRSPCSECALAAFVPQGLEKKRVPCRYIPLNERGETIDSFYRTGTTDELEVAVVKWLKATIERLERENEPAAPAERTPTVDMKANVVSQVSPSIEDVSMFWKCANPDCSAPFDFRQGRFFRFPKTHSAGEIAPNTHCVQHLWLCAPCSQKFTLEHTEHNGVRLQNRPDVPWAVEISKFVAAG